MSWERAHAGFASSRDVKQISASPLPTHGRNGPCPPEPHYHMVEMETQRDIGIRGQQIHVDQAVDGGLHLSSIILMNLGVHG